MSPNKPESEILEKAQKHATITVMISFLKLYNNIKSAETFSLNTNKQNNKHNIGDNVFVVS